MSKTTVRKATPLDRAVGRYLETQEEQQELGNLAVSTVNLRRYALAILTEWAHGAGIEDPAALDDSALNKWLAWMLKRRRNGKQTSRETSISYQRQAGPFLKWVKAPMGDGYKRLKGEGDRTQDDAPSPEEISRMEDACNPDDERDKLNIRLLGQSGLRVQELLNLKPSDLREGAEGISFSVRVLGKGNRREQKKERFAPVDPDVYERLRDYAGQVAKKDAEHGSADKRGFIFYSRRRTSRKKGGHIERLTRSGVDQLVRNLAETAKVSRSDYRVYPHLLRHAAISNWLLAKVPPVTVARWVGHSDLKLIMKIYAHLGLDKTYESFPVWAKKKKKSAA
jgi:integrase